MSGRHQARSWITIILLLEALLASAQGTEKAIEAAVLFGAAVLAATVAGLVISVLYLFKRRPWQRAVVVVFGIALLGTAVFIASHEHSNSDMDFVQGLVSVTGSLFLLVGVFLPSRERRSS
jgi:uncharacterized membrane protein AbrB (regulator of aidB expression)